MTQEMVILYDWSKYTDLIRTNDGEITHLEYLQKEQKRILQSDDRIVKIETKYPLMRMLVNDVAGKESCKETNRRRLKQGSKYDPREEGRNYEILSQ